MRLEDEMRMTPIGCIQMQQELDTVERSSPTHQTRIEYLICTTYDCCTAACASPLFARIVMTKINEKMKKMTVIVINMRNIGVGDGVAAKAPMPMTIMMTIPRVKDRAWL